MKLHRLFSRSPPETAADKRLSLPRLVLVEACVLLVGVLALLGLGTHVAPHVLALGLSFWPT
jgi:hypothetical protein